MHVVFICNEYPPHQHGGVGSLTQTIARSVVRAGHHATAIGTYPAASVRGHECTENDEGVQVVRLASRSRLPLLRAFGEQRRLWRFILRRHRSHPVDLVEGPEPSFWAAPGRLPFPTMVRMNGGHRFFADAENRRPARARSWVERRSLARSDDLVSVSDYTARRTAALIDLGGRPIRIIPNPVDTDRFRPTGRPVPGTVVFFGTLCEKKGVRQLVESFPAVAAGVPGARLVIAGRDLFDPVTTGSFRARLESLVPAGLADRVEFLGPLDQDAVRELIAGADVCALPSHMEALPVAWLEVLASGRPLVASSTGPGPEVVVDGQSGLLVDPHDPAAIADAVTALLTDADRRARFSAAARVRAVEQFSIDHLISLNLEHYAALCRRWSADHR